MVVIPDAETTVARCATLAKTLFAAVLALGATPALAQHVVTDYEAGKLTLDALTATPIPVVHHVYYRTQRYGTMRAVQAASFHRGIRVSTMRHLGTSHRRHRG